MSKPNPSSTVTVQPMEHLVNWMLEHEPKRLLEMHRSDRLIPYLQQREKDHLQQILDMKKDNPRMSDQQCEEIALSLLLPTGAGHPGAEKPLAKGIVDEILFAVRSAPNL